MNFVSSFDGYPRGHRQTKKIEIGLLVAGLATFVLLYNTQAILPYFTRDLRISPSQSALSVSVATAGLAVGLIAAAPVSERIGRVALIRFSLLSASALGLVSAFVTDWPTFLVLRFVMGVLLAGLPATAAVYLKEEIHPDYATAATGIYIFGTTLGGLSARLITSGVVSLHERFDLGSPLGLDAAHFALFVSALAASVCAVGAWLLLPQSRGFAPHPVHPRQLVRDFAKVFTDPVLVGLYVLAFFGMGAFVGTFNVLGFRLEAAPYGLSVAVVGLLYLTYPVAGFVGARAARLANRYSMRAVIVFGPLTALVGVGLLATSPLAVIVFGLLVLASGFFITHSIASAWVPSRGAARLGLPAQAASMYMLFYYMGSSAAGNLTPVAWQDFGWWGVTAMTGAFMGVSLLIAIALAKSKKA